MSATAVAARPYIGLRYFEERDAHLFYGRDEHVAELLAKVAQNRFLAVMGSSGCGKSSLVRAGLLPELRSGMIPKAGPRWKVVEFRPGNAPLEELGGTIRSELKIEHAQSLVEEGPLGIARAVAGAKLDEGTNVIVIADQFEEVFRFQREESAHGRGMEAAEQCHALARRLLDAAAQPELPIYVLLVLRSDYLGECAQFPDLPERMSESLYLVPRLRRDQLQEAITAPVGGAIEAAVVQRLLSEVGSDPDQLPRLQHLLGRMWDRAGGGRLTMQHYTEAGGWEHGLEQHLGEVDGALNQTQQAACARIFQQLSELDKGRAIRRRADISELIEICGPETSEVVRRFRAEGFLTPRENPVDITHECILREWPRLKEWLEKENRSARRLRELADATKDAGWRAGLSTQEQKPIRELAGLTLQNLVDWRDDAHPTRAWAARYVTAVDFETAYGYLQWSEARERAQKKRRRMVIGLLIGLLIAVAIGTGIMAALARGYYRLAVAATHQADILKNQANILRTEGDKLRIEGREALANAIRFRQLAQRQQTVAEANAKRAAQAQSLAEDAATAAEAKSLGLAALRDFDSGRQLEALIEAMQAGRKLQSLQRKMAGSGQYPPGDPLLALNRILNNIRERDVIEHIEAAKVTGGDGRKGVSGQLACSHVPGLGSDAELSKLMGHSRDSRILAKGCTPDGKYLVTTATDGTVRLLNVAGGQPALIGLLGGAGLEFLDAQHFAAKNVWNTTVSFDLSGANSHGSIDLTGHNRIVSAIAFNRNSNLLATGSLDGEIRLWNLQGNPVGRPISSVKASVLALQFGPDGEQFRSFTDAGDVQLWNLSGQAASSPAKTGTGPIFAIFRPDGRAVGVAQAGGYSFVYDLVSERSKSVNGKHTGWVFGLAFDPTADIVATAGADDTIGICDGKACPSVPPIVAGQGQVMSVALSPNGKFLASGGEDKTVKLWTLDGKEVGKLVGHEGKVLNVAFSSDGRFLASAGSDGTVRLWFSSGDQFSEFPGPRGSRFGEASGGDFGAFGMALSSDGRYIAIAESDNSVRVYRIQNLEELLDAACAWLGPYLASHPDAPHVCPNHRDK